MYFASNFPRKLPLLSRKPGPAGNDGLPSAIECGNQGANGVRSKYARVYMIVEEVAHFTPVSGVGDAMVLWFWRFGECLFKSGQRSRIYCTITRKEPFAPSWHKVAALLNPRANP